MIDLGKIKQLRQSTGAGFKDCGIAIEKAKGDLDKAAEILRVKGISKASKKMSRIAKEGVIAVTGNEKKKSIIEINCETDFVAKNDDFINFVKEVSDINYSMNSNLEKLKNSKMKNSKSVNENLVLLISKIGEKITLRRSKFFDNKGVNFSYVHNSLEKNIGKVISVVKLEKNEKIDLKEIGSKLAMHIAASSPIAIDENEIGRDILNKELEIIREEVKNSGKKGEMIEKIANGKLKKFVSDNTLLNQIWIMDTKKKVKEVLKSCSGEEEIKVLDFVRFKVGEGV